MNRRCQRTDSEQVFFTKTSTKKPTVLFLCWCVDKALHGCTYEFQSLRVLYPEKVRPYIFLAMLFGTYTENSEFPSLGPSCQQPIKFIEFSLENSTFFGVG
jgi:hypothetical protein